MLASQSTQHNPATAQPRHHATDGSLCVAVLAGGDSAEREISLKSGRHVFDALQASGHHAVQIDPLQTSLTGVDWAPFDVAFIALHGGAGEDGQIQAQLETLGVPYTGSSPAACRLAMSKVATKQRWLAEGLPTPQFVAFDTAQPEDSARHAIASLGYPLIVKPDGQGSSLGVAIAPRACDLPTAIAEASRYGQHLLAEQMIVGREITVAVLGRQALPPVEIAHSAKLFDYQAKYSSPKTEYYLRDENFEGDPTTAWQELAVAAAAALKTVGLVRVDMMIDEDQQPWLLEVNTVPGLSQRSLAPMAAAHAGIDMACLCNHMIAGALAHAKQPTT